MTIEQMKKANDVLNKQELVVSYHQDLISKIESLKTPPGMCETSQLKYLQLKVESTDYQKDLIELRTQLLDAVDDICMEFLNKYQKQFDLI
jgi:hypothetical protein